jgi:hypothetical protein
MDALQADLKNISAAVKDKPDLLTGDLKGKLSSAGRNLGTLARDGSRGAHNFEYAMKVMDQAGNDLEAVKAVVK